MSRRAKSGPQIWLMFSPELLLLFLVYSAERLQQTIKRSEFSCNSQKLRHYQRFNRPQARVIQQQRADQSNQNRAWFAGPHGTSWRESQLSKWRSSGSDGHSSLWHGNMTTTICLFPIKAPKDEKSEHTEQFKASSEACNCCDELPALPSTPLTQWDYLNSHLMLKDENLSWKPRLLLKSNALPPENIITPRTDGGNEANAEGWWWSEAFWSSRQHLEVQLDDRVWIIQQIEWKTDLWSLLAQLFSTGWREKSSEFSAGVMVLTETWHNDPSFMGWLPDPTRGPWASQQSVWYWSAFLTFLPML